MRTNLHPRVDNSETSRNGDYLPSRWEAQKDCVNRIFRTKTSANPESAVGLMSMGASGPEVLTTLTTNQGDILEGLHRTKVQGHSHLHRSIMVASLALKHRQNKSQKQRIIVFTCSPLSDDLESQSALVKLAKRMKKNNVSVDMIALGELGDETISKLRAFNDAVAGGNGSHLEIVPADGKLLSDVVTSSPILAEENGNAGGPSGGSEEGGAGIGAGAGGSGGGSGFEFDVDPATDPELALALRMSMEEETARQEREKQQEAKTDKPQLESVPEENKTGEGDSLLTTDNTGQGSNKNADNDNDKDKDGAAGDRMDTA